MSAESDSPAFPSTNEVRVGDCITNGHSGMSLRDYFAAKAMQSAITTSSVPWMTRDHACAVAVAETAYQVADAMLEMRSKT